MYSPLFAMALNLSPLAIAVIVVATVLVLGANVFFGIQQRQEQLNDQAKK